MYETPNWMYEVGNLTISFCKVKRLNWANHAGAARTNRILLTRQLGTGGRQKTDNPNQ